MKALLSLLIAVTLFSCSKDSSNNKPAITMETLAGDYKITAAKSTYGGAEVDVYKDYFPSCQKDDIYHLKADGTFTITDEGEVCDPTTETSGEWTLTEQKVTIGTQFEFNITSFDGTMLIGTTTYSITTPITATLNVTVVFTKQ